MSAQRSDEERSALFKDFASTHQTVNRYIASNTQAIQSRTIEQRLLVLFYAAQHNSEHRGPCYINPKQSVLLFKKTKAQEVRVLSSMRPGLFHAYLKPCGHETSETVPP